jgi:hypothetical protein
MIRAKETIHHDLLETNSAWYFQGHYYRKCATDGNDFISKSSTLEQVLLHFVVCSWMSWRRLGA